MNHSQPQLPRPVRVLVAEDDERTQKALGFLLERHGYSATTNLAFGGDDWSTLYFTSRNELGAVKLRIAGIPVPVQKKA